MYTFKFISFYFWFLKITFSLKMYFSFIVMWLFYMITKSNLYIKQDMFKEV